MCPTTPLPSTARSVTADRACHGFGYSASLMTLRQPHSSSVTDTSMFRILKSRVLWDKLACVIADLCRRFGGTQCLHFQGKVIQPSSKSHKIVLFTVTAVKTSNLTSRGLFVDEPVDLQSSAYTGINIAGTLRRFITCTLRHTLGNGIRSSRSCSRHGELSNA
jgi:hypothetical protein